MNSRNDDATINQLKTDPFYCFCRSLPGVTEDIKWDHNLVFSVANKMFVVFQLPRGESLSFKATEDVYDVLTQQEGMRSAPYLGRYNWVAVDGRDRLPFDGLCALIRTSYDLVVAKLPRRTRENLSSDHQPKP